MYNIYIYIHRQPNRKEQQKIKKKNEKNNKRKIKEKLYHVQRSVAHIKIKTKKKTKCMMFNDRAILNYVNDLLNIDESGVSVYIIV